MSEDKATAAVDLGGMTYLETTLLNMAVPGTEDDDKPKLTGWILTLAGPAHPVSVEVFRRQTDRANKIAIEKEQARVNGKKWKAEDQDSDEIRERTVKDICARVLGWKPAPDFKDGKGAREYSPEAAVELFMDRSKGPFFAQLVRKLLADKTFLTASANG